MSKRKQDDPTNNDDSDGEDINLVNVDFEFFDPNPDVDFIALKRLILQLFQTDAELFHPDQLADLILSQPLVGSTVKTDGRETDPYAFLTVLNMHVHQNHPSIKALIEYALAKSANNIPLHSTLQNILGSAGLASSNHAGFIFCERLVNMPVQVIPHMYRMLVDEIKWAVEEDEPYVFTHFLIFSRTYRMSAEEQAELQAAAPQAKRPRKSLPTSSAGGVFSFHHEDELTQQVALHTLDYTFTGAPPREKDSFGLDVGGRMMLVPAEQLPGLVARMAEVYAVPS
ncbi:hypothetical protein HETIRDRAFT_443367 [Heterobasidion irregulare TC 32-1]|uniref:Protein BCP1 n=1 Tax=Heterobasidion irregulare (strain TC 32-1) TaxID=747525 RepID=W4KPX1_HETIT|nr:uncharacterized protein HETIRDRAFT_443367 [Heterobasidion irregulare TC 32-1]ETW87759.1 hypothetical protein HETIRDRAFT_443367 [Heterobasidion irregulare TC 32-1]